jgi:hypothetical protein
MFVFRRIRRISPVCPCIRMANAAESFQRRSLVYRTKSGGLIPGGLRLAPEAVNSRATVNGTGRITDRSHHR